MVANIHFIWSGNIKRVLIFIIKDDNIKVFVKKKH